MPDTIINTRNTKINTIVFVFQEVIVSVERCARVSVKGLKQGGNGIFAFLKLMVVWCVKVLLETNKSIFREASWETTDNDLFEP